MAAAAGIRVSRVSRKGIRSPLFLSPDRMIGAMTYRSTLPRLSLYGRFGLKVDASRNGLRCWGVERQY